MSPTRAGRFLTTGPPGKSKNRGCFGSNILLEEAGEKKKKHIWHNVVKHKVTGFHIFHKSSLKYLTIVYDFTVYHFFYMSG